MATERKDSEGVLRIAIIGAGFSGALVAIHLLRQEGPVHIDIVDPRLPGRGLAYSTFYGEHLLNVPAIRMSAFGSEPAHFVEWLRTHGMPDVDANAFAPRRLYGLYIQDTLEAASRSAGCSSRFQHHLSEATHLAFEGLSVDVFLRNGERLQADRVILATGNPAPRTVLGQSKAYFSSPWVPGALSNVPPDSDILLLGAGLTAVDAFIALESQGHKGRIHMLSRRGKLPKAHTSYRPLPAPIPLPEQLSAKTLLHSVRHEVRKAQMEGVDWRAVLDSIRPVTNDIWLQLSRDEQGRFFRHLKTWWDIHRHRMAPEIGSRIDDAVSRKQLLVYAGRLKQMRAADSHLETEIRLKNGQIISLSAERFINCTGPDVDYLRSSNGLIRHLLESGFATPGGGGKGLQTSPKGELVDITGSCLDWLLTLGPPRFGDLFETIAVPELRRQAEALANHLLSIAREPVEVMPEIFVAAGI